MLPILQEMIDAVPCGRDYCATRTHAVPINGVQWRAQCSCFKAPWLVEPALRVERNLQLISEPFPESQSECVRPKANALVHACAAREGTGRELFVLAQLTQAVEMKTAIA
jgi:hypothetical protein